MGRLVGGEEPDEQEHRRVCGQTEPVANRTVTATLNFSFDAAKLRPWSPAAPYWSSWAMAQTFFPCPPCLM